MVSANNYRVPYPVYPLGVSYLATYLADRLPGAEIAVFDFNLASGDDFAAWLREGAFDVVGISLRNIDDTNIFERNCFMAHYRKVMAVARANTTAPVVIGGPGFSVFPEMVFRELEPDYAIAGEGEETLLQLIGALSAGEVRAAGIEGLVWRDTAGEIKVNPRSSYISAPGLRVDPLLAEYYWERSGMMNIQTKRGCPYGCIYCSYPLIDGRRVRTLDAATVVDNIERMWREKGIDYFFFTDSIFNIDRHYNRELAERMITRGLKVCWGAYFSPRDLTYGDLKLYRRSGLTHIEFGTDSFSDTQLENYGKAFRFDDIREQSENCERLGIFYAHFLILGGWGETEATLDETFERSGQLGRTVIFPYVGMRIYPGTRLYEIALSEGVINGDAELIDPVYYVSKDIDVASLAGRAAATGQKWIFAGDDHTELMGRFRARKRRGPLWEYLRY